MENFGNFTERKGAAAQIGETQGGKHKEEHEVAGDHQQNCQRGRGVHKIPQICVLQVHRPQVSARA